MAPDLSTAVSGAIAGLIAGAIANLIFPGLKDDFGEGIAALVTTFLCGFVFLILVGLFLLASGKRNS
jgi:hypothetical protein